MIDGGSASLTAQATYREVDGEKIVHYTSERSFTRGSRRFEGDFESTLTWTSGTNWVTRNSEGRVTTSERTSDVTIEDYTRCARSCPMSGVITVSEGGAANTLTFDGSTIAQLRRADGRVESVRFDCEE